MRIKLLIALLIALFLVVCYLYGMDYIKQRQEQKALTSQLTDITQTLNQMPVPPQNLEERLAAVQASLATEQNAFPSELNSTQIINDILELAVNNHIIAIPLVTQPWKSENLGEHDYNVLRLNVTARGSFVELVSFIGELENGEFKTLIIEQLSVTRVVEKAEETGFHEGTIPAIASLDIAIYTQSITSY